MIFKNIFIHLFWYLLKYSGFIRLWRYTHRYDICILMLHGVIDDGAKTKWKPLRHYLNSNDLENALSTLSKFYNFISLSDAISMLRSEKEFMENCLVLTFDDGYKNNLNCALPILTKYGSPIAIFPATNHIEKRKPFWFDRLDYALQHTDFKSRNVQIADTSIILNKDSRNTLNASFLELRTAAKAKKRNDLEMIYELTDLAVTLEKESGNSLLDIFESDDYSSLLSWDEIRRSSTNQNVTYGSHTTDHIRLPLVDDSLIKQQLVDSKIALESVTGKECKYFCYPNGNHSSKTRGFVIDSGYIAALTTDCGLNRKGCDLFTLQRYPFPASTNPIAIEATACGLHYALNNFFRAILSFRR